MNPAGHTRVSSQYIKTQNQISAANAMATPSSKSVKSEIPNTVRVDWNDAELQEVFM